jgi:hypothetical protein
LRGALRRYDPQPFGRAPFDHAVRERSFGLLRADGTEKPAAREIRAFAGRLERGEVTMGTAPKLLDVSADAYYATPDVHFRRLYARWCEARG